MTESQVKPALLTMMSSPLNRSRAVVLNRAANVGSTTLPLHAAAWPPSDTICSAVSLPGRSSRSFTTTRAPSDASLSAIARPIPRPAPVTSATFPSRFIPSRHGLHERLDLAVHRNRRLAEHHRHVVARNERVPNVRKDRGSALGVLGFDERRRARWAVRALGVEQQCRLSNRRHQLEPRL